MDYLKRYAKFLKSILKPSRAVRVVFDSSNGATGLVAHAVFGDKKKVEAIFVNDNPDGNFPAHGPNPMNEAAIEDISKSVRRNHADLGAIYDADGDRVLFIDDRGRQVFPDIAGFLMSKYFRGPIGIDLRVGYLAKELLKKASRKLVETPVGTYYIKKIMRAKKIPFAAEITGHYYFRFGDAYFDSGMAATIYMINAVADLKKQGYSLSAWIGAQPQFYRQPEMNFEVKDKAGAIRRIEKAYKQKAKKIFRFDGLKMEFSDWWLSVRPSANDPVLRLNLEAKTKKVFEEQLARLKSLI